MARQLTTWCYVGIARPEWDARHHDGRPARQVRLYVTTTSKRAAAEAFEISISHFNDYASDLAEPLEELKTWPPGTVAVGPLDPHGTISGSGFIQVLQIP